ncbi:hypothetical protein ACQ4LE_009013 [Meloidogyne hapla]
MLPFYLFIGVLLAIILFLFVIGLSLPGRLPFVIEGKHAVITGGSKGIGRCIAEQLLKEGCKIVSIIARDVESLEKTKQELIEECGLNSDDKSVKIYSLDLSSGQKAIKDVIEKIISDSGPIDLLVNNAGTCIQNAFDELPEDAFERQMKTNFLSAVYMTRAVLPQMKERRSGHISFVSSAAGQCAIWGYSAYSPSKFAVRALADVLYMELLPYEIGVSVLFPPNTATEGFDEELRTMPEQIRQISNSAGVFPPKQVAAALIRSIRLGDFWTCIGFEGKILGFLSAAASPETNFPNAVAQIFFAGIIRGIMLIYTAQFNAIIKNCYKKITEGWFSSSHFFILTKLVHFLKERIKMQIIRDELLKAKETAKNWFKWWLTINNNNVVEKDADGNTFNVVDSVILSNKEEKKQSWMTDDGRDKRKWTEKSFPERHNAAEALRIQNKADENNFGDNQSLLISSDGDRISSLLFL